MGDDLLAELTVDECLDHLRRLTVGRFAVAMHDEPPHVVPVNYVMDGDVVVFRTGPGEKLAALADRPATFQADDIDPFHRTGWSVLVQGVAYEATLEEIERSPMVVSWRGGLDRWIRLVPVSITGRVLRPEPGDPDPRGYR